MAFMGPEIIEDVFVTVETRDGTWNFPADCIGSLAACDIGPDDARFEELSAACADYVEGRRPFERIEVRSGFGARFSAPGYLDCSEWSVHPTLADAIEELANQAGDCETLAELASIAEGAGIAQTFYDPAECPDKGCETCEVRS